MLMMQEESLRMQDGSLRVTEVAPPQQPNGAGGGAAHAGSSSHLQRGPSTRSAPSNIKGRQQKMIQANQPSFRVQALVDRHGGGGFAAGGDQGSQRSYRSGGSTHSMKVPPRLHSSRRLLQMSWHGQDSKSNFQASSISGSIADIFGDSIRITDLEVTNNMMMPTGGGNDSASMLGCDNGSTHTFASAASSKWGQQSVKFRANHFVAANTSETTLQMHYAVGELLGEGGFGEVYSCRHLQSGEPRAVKVIAKHPNPQENAKVITEFDIVKDLDHPNILKLYALYESETHFFLVTDIYAGGELYDELEEFGRFNEDDAALLMNNVLSCLNHCHKKKLAHRDLKPENILLEANKNFEDLKIIDFGLAAFGDRFTDLEGSTYYMSPQVIEGNYNCKCDIWSTGVIAYVCLAGFAPFDGQDEQDVIQSILCGRVDFEDATWDDVSEDAMDFIAYLLTYEEEHRPTAEQALQHPWLQQIRQRRDRHCAKRRESTRMSLTNLQSFQANSKLKQCVCSLIASQFLKKHEKEEIDAVFRSLDHDCDGKLTRQDVETSYKQFFGRALSAEDLDSMFEQVNFSGSGAIEYSEFVVASLMEKNLIDDFKLMAAFKIFDKENKGYISVDDLKQVLALDDDMEGYILNVIVRQVDDNGDGKISFDEFKDMMFSNAVIPPKPSSSGRRAAARKSHGSGATLSSGSSTMRNKVVGNARSNRSNCSSTLSVESFSMNSAGNMTITEDLFEDDSNHMRKDDMMMTADDMSLHSNASFRHVFNMFDDKLKK